MAEPSNKTQRQDRNQNPRSWIDLPDNVTASILLQLGAIEILVTAMNVCTTWRKICKDPRKWLTIDMCDVSVYGESPSPYPMDKLCRKAIDLSCGNLVDISVHNFGPDDLHKHITDSCRGIKRLCIVYSDIANSGLIEAAPMLPLLEDLEISYCNYRLDITPFNMFHCIQHGYLEGLQHLQLFENRLTSKGLGAILDGCPLLESLDLRQCWHINLEPELAHHWLVKLDEELQRRCIDSIKNLRLPHDSKHDYERLAAEKLVHKEFVEESKNYIVSS